MASAIDAEIERRRAAWDRAYEARSGHLRCHREQRAWHPLGTPNRVDADKRARREWSRLDSAELETRAHLASALRLRGYRPLAPGLYAVERA